MEKIKEKREAQGLSRRELAVRVGVSKRTVESWESGRRYPNRKTIKKLEEVLGVIY